VEALAHQDYVPAMPEHDSNDEYTSFGFREVPREEKAERVREVFDRVAARYDLMNDVMSAGMHRAWKYAAVAKLNPQPGETILDVAGGTGDLARRIRKRAEAVRARRGGAEAQIIVLDINEEMLEAGRRRGEDKISWRKGDAERLPIRDETADAYIIGFGIRNVTEPQNALDDAYRTLKRGGRYFCLEFSRLAIAGLEPAYDAYSFHLIPKLGQWIAKDEASYRYLVESIRRFPDQETFAGMIRRAGFGRVGYRNFAGGVVALHWGYKV
jgi:demethylmenaquinone methyltransferase/2-methoxy-6-polyprenyl-1,4-benzoquinol methylase